jgi:hypothetical protein
MFAPLALLALGERAPREFSQRYLGAAGIAAMLIFTILIGYRYEVGGDWWNYLLQFQYMQYLTFSEFLERGIDPGYGLLNSFSGSMDWGIIGVNVMSAALFSLGLIVFCRQQPRPWLALLVAIPYLVIVVGMGYTRQAAAIGLAMLGLSALERNSRIGFAIFVIVAGQFHKSAVILLPIAILATTEKRIWTTIWVAITFALTYWAILHDSLDQLATTYIDAQMQSQGATIRIAMNALPAVLFLSLRNKLVLLPAERRLWTWFSILALASVGLLFILPSTAIDRMALYLIPLQLFVLCRLPDALKRLNISSSSVAFGIVAYSAAVQFVWLNFAAHANAWVPYKFYPFAVL